MEDVLRSARAKQDVYPFRAELRSLSCVALLAKQDGGPFLPMKYVYLLKSLSHPHQRYVGCTADLPARLALHNQGRVPHTSKYLPWQIHVAIRFQEDRRADEFERYLKSGSGHAFANRHLW